MGLLSMLEEECVMPSIVSHCLYNGRRNATSALFG
jgi:hypothetical protein